MQESPTSLVKQEVDPKVAIITGYLEKFATIAGRPVTPQLYDVYVEALSRFDQRRIEKGLRKYLEEGQSWPWPGTLAEYIEEEI